MFRPVFEALEQRELFAADLQAAVPQTADAVTMPKLDGSSEDAAYVSSSAARAAQIASDGAFIEKFAGGRILPYIEQDNLYKSLSSSSLEAAHDEVFQLLGRMGESSPLAGQPQGIIAILIGLAAQPQGGGPLSART